MRVGMKTQKPFTMAALRDLWRDPDGAELYSFAIITAAANNLLRPIDAHMHDPLGQPVGSLSRFLILKKFFLCHVQ